MEDSTNSGINLEMHPDGRNLGPTVIVEDESSKSSLCNDGEEPKEQVRDHLVANKKITKMPTKSDVCSEKFNKDWRYHERKRHPLGESWENHIVRQHKEKNVGIFGWSFEFVHRVEIQKCAQVGGRNAKEVRLVYDQKYMRIDEHFKESQECRI